MLITSLRISDVVSLQPSNIQYVDGRGVLVKINIKTGTETALPLPDFLADIYTFNLNNHGRIFSSRAKHPSNVRLRLGEFMMKYPEMHKTYSYTRCNYLGEIVTIQGKFYDLVHTHMLRKTAITLMIASGMSIDHVRFASGHSANSQSINRYIGFVEQRHKSEVSNYYSKLLS
jgi:integrase